LSAFALLVSFKRLGIRASFLFAYFSPFLSFGLFVCSCAGFLKKGLNELWSIFGWMQSGPVNKTYSLYDYICSLWSGFGSCSW